MKIKSFYKIFILTLITVFVCSACKASNDTSEKITPTPNGNQRSKEGSWADIDTSKEVTINGYLIGDAPEGLDAVMEALNIKLKEELNAALIIHYLSWSDYKTKYPLILASGEDVDFIFTADWCMYGQEATKNAFREITEDDLAKYMPRHYTNCNPEAYNQARLNGKMYMITTSSPDIRVTCMLYRKDLAEKYGITNLNKLSDFTEYFKAISENETDIVPMHMAASYDNIWLFLANEFSNEINVTNALCCYTEDIEANVAPIYEEPYAASFRYAFRIMKEWYDAGYVNKDVLPNEITSKEAFMEGKAAIAIGNSVDLQSVLATCKEREYDVGIIPLLDSQKKTSAVPYINNGVAVSTSSENPERTMMVLDLIMEEKEYNYLVYYGIEGKNYEITEDGKVGLPRGVTDVTNTYPVDAAGFWFTNKNQHLPSASWTEDYVELKKKIPDMLYTNPYIEFSPDLTNIQSEVADISLVTQQYMQPMSYGIINDVDQGMEILKEKLIYAGMDKVKIEVQKQIKEYLGSK